MKMLLTVEMPNEPFNSLAKDGKVGELLNKILAAMKPEVTYFTEQDGLRAAIFVVDVESPSDVPALAEPFFLVFQAKCRFRILMTPEDLKKAGLDELGKQWV